MPTRAFAIVRSSPEPPDVPMATNRVLDSFKDYVVRVMRENNLSAEDVAKNSKRRGGSIARPTVQMFVQGKTPNPGIITLRDLAWGLLRPLDEVMAEALGENIADQVGFSRSELANLYDIGKDLPVSEQRIFRRYVQMLEREMRRLLRGDG